MAAEVGSDTRDLDVVQRWFQSVIRHPGGIEQGVASDEAQQLIRLDRGELERVIKRSKNLSAVERIHVYANAYYARLLECLGESFPVLRRALGAELFDDFAFEYLQRYPSRSYTLGLLGANFHQFLDETRPDRLADGTVPEVNWPDFMIDLAKFEWEVAEVFDGPGIEGEPVLDASDIQAVGPDLWASAKVELVPCLRLMAFEYPINDYFTQAKESDEDAELAIPEPRPQYVVLTRRQYIVRRIELLEPQYRLLVALHAGQTVGESIMAAADSFQGSDDEFMELLGAWFEFFVSRSFFKAIHV